MTQQPGGPKGEIPGEEIWQKHLQYWKSDADMVRDSLPEEMKYLVGEWNEVSGVSDGAGESGDG